jgi:hypothetical protein
MGPNQNHSKMFGEIDKLTQKLIWKYKENRRAKTFFDKA